MLGKDATNKLISAAFSAVRSEPVLSADPPAVVYHFTDADGLIGIVKDGRIRATRAACTNDAMENEHGRRVAREILEKRKQHTERKYRSESYDTALNDLLAPKLWFDPFVASFCVRVDKSVHWLHYGRQGHGYAIGFDAREIPLGDTWNSVHVIYCETDQTRVLDSIFATFESSALEIIGGLSPDERNDAETLRGELLSQLSRALTPCFKDHAFREEEEWRIFRIHIESPTTSKQFMVTPEFRAVNGNMIPYTELELLTGNSSPIREIVLGYQIDEVVTGESLRFLLRKAGLPLDKIEIRKSPVPVRGVG